MIPKKIFNPNSKTHRANLMVVIGGLLMFLPGLEGSIPPSLYPWILFGVATVNHILRNVTTTAIDDK